MQQIICQSTTSASGSTGFGRGAATARTGARRRFRRVGWIAGALACAALPLAAQCGGLTSAPAKTAKDSFAQLALLLGFGVERASVTGQEMTDEADIFAAVDLASLGSMADLDAPAAARRIERLPWIETARVRRAFPNALEIRVTERRPFAVWRRNGDETLIGADGRVLATVMPGSTPGLPVVSGAGAPAEASILFATLAGYAGLKTHVARAERVARRRWTLHLDNGAVVHLPSDSDAAALDGLARSGGLEAVLSHPGLVVDLRISGRMATRFALSDRT